ncbi:MAG: DUF1549 domain-containing protein [Planctomycetes bacterium]|nr:DUF1549 domain-containing protein [Planctomycetota bacterium]MCB9886656.1 DUF1549 domain-containing protein [Planctomycetota bacterium]
MPSRLANSSPAVLFLTVGLAAQQPADWWAYQPLVRPAVPAVAQADWPRNPIDAFVLAGLEDRGLRPMPAADKHTLLRRVTYDLTGLPPTAAEIEAFVRDDSADAYDKVVERLLASPHYGEKWARHWLDLVRYADTDGYERDRKKPFVWRYRDWVVDAFNGDMPYGEFVRRQLAGDERPDATVADLVATGYFRLGIFDDEPTDPQQHRYDDLDGMADTTARTMLGISMGCARCHDHKKDPLLQREYASFLSFFENIKQYDLQARRVPADGAVAQHEAALVEFDRQVAALGERLRAGAAQRWKELPEAARAAWLQQASAGQVAAFPGDPSSATELIDARGGVAGKVNGQVVPCEGVEGQGLRFDGDDHVVLPRLVEDSFTVSFFVRSDQRGDGNAKDRRWYLGTGLVDGEVPGIVHDWGIAWHSDGYIVAGTGNPDTFVSSAGGFNDGKWHHVAFTRDQVTGRITLYVDGTLAGEGVGSKAKLDAPPRLLVGRTQTGGRGFRGDLDELVFFERALEPAEVAGLALRLPAGAASARMLAEGAGGPDDAAAASGLAELAALHRPDVATSEVLAVQEMGPEPAESFVRLRGNVHSLGPKVEPGFPSMLGAAANVPIEPVPTRTSSGRRTVLADWIAGPGNPLTWRVVANRLWQHHFGRGIVRSSNDFGRLGDLPTDSRLLDWLASEMLTRGGSIKAMHRLLVTSATYRMQSSPNQACSDVDPINDLFWRFDRRRLTAEEVRDSILSVSGALNLQVGGPTVFPPMPAAVLATASRPEDAWGKSTPDQEVRRTLYVHTKRSLQMPLLVGFDQADTDNSCPVRFATVQPTQALTLWNGEFAHQEAARMAKRLERARPDLAARITMGLELVTQQPARSDEVERLVALHAALCRDYGKSDAEALQRVCLVLLNSNEFLYLD